MTGEIIFRRCLEEDIESVLELWRDADATASVTDTSYDLRRTLNSGVSSVLVAQSGGRIVGSIIGTFDGWRGNIYRLAVHPEYRRRGIARRLVSEAEAWLRDKGAKRVTALVEKTTLGPPISGTPPSLSWSRRTSGMCGNCSTNPEGGTWGSQRTK